MRIPVATWRIQFTSDFRFEDARRIVPWLHRLGISHIYASPIFAARPGSTHGYDVTDPTRINEELGGRDAFDMLAAELKTHDMGLVLDIVPNHMAASADNPWWMDVLENGASSRFANFFGINWNIAADEHGARIIVPTLGAPYGEVLDRGELRLILEERGFRIKYYESIFPIGVATWTHVLSLRPEQRPENHEFIMLVETVERIPPRTAAYWEAIEARQFEVGGVKQDLWRLYNADPRVRDFVDVNIGMVNADRWRLHQFLEAQAYRLAWWRMASEKINYRRFFDVHELAGIRVDDRSVFEATHCLIFDLINAAQLDGLRIDHIDGLFDPKLYLDWLPHESTYVVVEKILSDREPLPDDWPIRGTSGYDFLALVNSVLIDREGFDRLRAMWSRHTGIAASREDIEYGRKKKVIDELFAGEFQDLGSALASLAEADLYARDLSPRDLRRALIEVTACLVVYRTYTSAEAVSERDRNYLLRAIEEACEREPSIGPAVYDFVRRVLTLELPPNLTQEQRGDWLRFVMRWQQISGPVMAKGVEDSTFYLYNPLVSMNEVGSIGRAIDVGEFHNYLQHRQKRWPNAMSGTSTHDTKRSEDVRARIDVLSEIPDEWLRYLSRWSRWHRDRRGEVDLNEEWYIYQSLLGVWPLHDADLPGLRERLHGYLRKSAREAREHSSWLNPNEEHEQALLAFTDSLLADERWMADFRRLFEKVEAYGAMNALSQVLLKITAPGVPDLYQGTVDWNFSLVDPDNRRPASTPQLTDLGAGPLELLETWRDGRIKVFVTEAALAFRKANHELFLEGEYVPLPVTGKRPENIIAYARCREDAWALVVVPRLTSKLSVTVRPPIGIRAWGDTELALPAGAPSGWRNVFTNARLKTRPAEGESPDRLPVFRILEQFPVALLSGRTRG
jgi:(1->4)-alpha-D-glucan 1-alpha-D-glucosylmutase